MRDDIYEQGRQVEEEEFPAVMKSFEPLCIELVQQFNVPLKEVELQIKESSQARTMFEQRTAATKADKDCLP